MPFKRFRSKLPRFIRNSKIWDSPSQETQKQLAFDKQVVWKNRKQKRIPNWRQFKYISSFFSAKERFLVILSILAIIGGLASGGLMVYGNYVEEVPAQGGNYTEGLVGYPLYINPILASTNDVDLDLVKLLFSGLLRYDENLELQPDLAESWEMVDAKEYTVVLKEGLTWHDGEPLTVEDVLFTYRAIQEPAVNSPLQLSLQDVTIEKIDERTIKFTLNNPFTPFASMLTVGILPQHIWSNLPASNIRLAEQNIKPVGSGPWTFSKLEKDKLGNIHSFTLQPFKGYHGQTPYISQLTFRFYPDFGTAISALNNNKVEGMSFVPRQLISTINNTQKYATHHLELPQYTSIFFNQSNNDSLNSKKVREALAYSIDRERLLNDVLDGLGQPVNGPLLPGMTGYDDLFEGYPYNPVEAQRLLDESEWEAVTAEEYIALERERIAEERASEDEESEDEAEEESDEGEEDTETTDEESEPLGELIEEESIEIDTGNQAVFRVKDGKALTIRLTTVDQPETIRAAEIIQNAWQSIGVKVQLDIISVSTLTSDILPRRDYEALLYGQILNVFPDHYTFWHSSQIEYPGLNLAGYADADVDELLEQARQTSDQVKQAELLRDFQIQLIEDLPAIFLYSPEYTYLMASKINGFAVEQISIPADRWNNIGEWYINTKQKFTGRE
jgi:peptide/nickel transport system substrate-binding protein